MRSPTSRGSEGIEPTDPGHAILISREGNRTEFASDSPGSKTTIKASIFVAFLDKKIFCFRLLVVSILHVFIYVFMMLFFMYVYIVCLWLTFDLICCYQQQLLILVKFYSRRFVCRDVYRFQLHCLACSFPSLPWKAKRRPLSL